MKVFNIPWKAWYGDKDFKLSFPQEWEVKVFPMHDAPFMGEENIKKAFSSPIESDPLYIIAKGKKKATIVVDDITRPTPAYKVLPFVIDELKQAGMKEKNINIIIGLGAHRPMIREDLIRKLGENIWNSVEIHNHQPFDNLVNLGISSKGTPIYINKLFMDSDIKIGVGSIVPHNYAGFAGGGKIVLPGIAGIKSIEANHQPKGLRGGIGFLKGNEARQDIEEIAQKSGLNFIVNTVINSKREIAGLFVGNLVKAHRKGVKLARRIYETEVSGKFDIGIFNAYPKDTELIISSSAFDAYLSTKNKMIRKNGIIIITTASPEGGGYHSLGGYGMKLFEYTDKFPLIKEAIKDKIIYIFSPNLTPQEVYKYYSHSVLFFREWDRLIENLKEEYYSKCRIAIFPNASIQLIKYNNLKKNI